MPLLDSLRRTLSAHAPPLIGPGDHVLVAVSGGPDSLALLHALHTLRDELHLAALGAAHFDHQLRGGESAADAAFVAGFCTARGIPWHLGTDDVAARARAGKISLQQAARAARYAFLEGTARRTGANKIATAHTQDDQVETVLLNILRGTGLDGLRGIPARRGLSIRPLLDVSRAEVEAYCREQGLMPRHDPSNDDPSHYTRNRIRLDLLPRLESDYNPAVRAALLRLSQVAARDADYLRQQAETALPTVTLTHDSERLVLDNNRLRALPPALLYHTLRAALAQIRGTLDGITHDHLDPLRAAVHGHRRLPFGLTTPAPPCSVRVTQRRMTLHSSLAGQVSS